MNNCESEKVIVFKSKEGQLQWNTIGSVFNTKKMIKDIENVGGTIIEVTSSKIAKSLVESDRNKYETFCKRFDF